MLCPCLSRIVVSFSLLIVHLYNALKKIYLYFCTEKRLIEDNLAKNCGSGTEEHESQLGHQPEAGQ